MEKLRNCPHCGGGVELYIRDVIKPPKMWEKLEEMERSYLSFIMCPIEGLVFYGAAGADKTEVVGATFKAWQSWELDEQKAIAPKAWGKQALEELPNG